MKLAGRFLDLRKPDSFGFYLNRMVVNGSRSHFRKQARERIRLAAVAGGPATVEPDVPARLALWEHLHSLPERQRAALILRFYGDLTEAQTAEILRCPVGTVKSLVSRGLHALRESMADE